MARSCKQHHITSKYDMDARGVQMPAALHMCHSWAAWAHVQRSMHGPAGRGHVPAVTEATTLTRLLTGGPP